MFRPGKIIKNLAFVFGVIALSAGLSYAVFAAWQEPNQTPPGCISGDPGCDAPLNIGPVGQTKTGGLILATDPTVTNGLSVLNGNVGIGTSSPQSLLHIKPGEIKLESTDALEYTDIHFSNNRSVAPFGKEYVVGNYAPDMANIDLRNKFFIRDNSGGGDRLIIDTNGNIGIGTTTPGAKLHLTSASGAADLELQSLPGNTASSDIHLKNSVQEFSVGMQGIGDPNIPNSFFIHDTNVGGIAGYRFVIKPTTGNIGIGTITPAQKLDVNGGVKIGSGAANGVGAPGKALCMVTATRTIGVCSTQPDATGNCTCQPIN